MRLNSKWQRYFGDMANFVAEASKDSTKVGALLIGNNREVLLTAYNGPPIGVKDTTERRQRPMKYMFASHAEANLISFAARNGIRTDGLSVVVTHQPCAGCARSLIQAGIQVVYHRGSPVAPESPYWEEFKASSAMLEEAGVSVFLCD